MKHGCAKVLLLLLAVAFLVILCRVARAQSPIIVRASHESFVSYYDVNARIPALVVYYLEASHFAGNAKVSGRHFKADTKLPRPRVKDGDYTNSGYVRGHLCAAGDRDSKKSWLKETYLTSNLAPMTMVCNSGSWKQIEDSVRLLSLNGHRLKVVKFPVNRYRELPAVGNTNVIQISVLHSSGLVRVLHSPGGCITVPDYFVCLATCLDCGLRFQGAAENSASASNTIFECAFLLNLLSPEVRLILTNILGTWNPEESETTTP